jgi:hypothetical protein
VGSDTIGTMLSVYFYGNSEVSTFQGLKYTASIVPNASNYISEVSTIQPAGLEKFHCMDLLSIDSPSGSKEKMSNTQTYE